MLVPICVHSIFIIFILRQKYSAPLTPRPCRSNAIGASHHFPQSASPQEPMVALLFRRLLTSVCPAPVPPTPHPVHPSHPAFPGLWSTPPNRSLCPPLLRLCSPLSPRRRRIATTSTMLWRRRRERRVRCCWYPPDHIGPGVTLPSCREAGAG